MFKIRSYYIPSWWSTGRWTGGDTEGGCGFGCVFGEMDNVGPISSSELATVDEKELSSSSESVSLDGVDDKHSSSSESVAVDDKELACYEIMQSACEQD